MKFWQKYHGTVKNSYSGPFITNTTLLWQICGRMTKNFVIILFYIIIYQHSYKQHTWWANSWETTVATLCLLPSEETPSLNSSAVSR